MTLPRTAADVLARHVVFEIESIDRLYLNVYVPELQRVGQVVGFLTRHRGNPIASTALVAPMSEGFVTAIRRYARTTSCTNTSPVVTVASRCYLSAGPRRKLGSSAPSDDATRSPVDRPGHRDGQPVLRLRRR
jgi:hypothetical protein